MKILYICTHNRCRSILSEAITNAHGQGKITAWSAGSHPAGEVHPLTLKYLQETNFPVDGLRSQSWDEFASLQPDIVITVCDSAANEMCPVWMGSAIKIHWGLPDPSKINDDAEKCKNAFYDVIQTIEERVKKLLSIKWHDIDNETRQLLLHQLSR
ncbi:MAG: arsenate reductase ArsC [Pseudomonadota bacterium]